MSTAAVDHASRWRPLDVARAWLPAVVVFALGLVAWQWILPDVLGVESFLLPRLSDVATRVLGGARRALVGRLADVQGGAGGLLLGASVGIAAALALARWRPLGSALMPYFIAANAVPIIAFAPITNAWFGTLSPWSKIVIAAVLCFFPVLVNTLRGLTSVHPSSVELMHSYAASERATVSGSCASPPRYRSSSRRLKVASVLAMIGAVVGDFFGGSTEALGVQIQSSVALSRYETRVGCDPRRKHPRHRALRFGCSARADRGSLAPDRALDWQSVTV